MVGKGEARNTKHLCDAILPGGATRKCSLGTTRNPVGCMTQMHGHTARMLQLMRAASYRLVIEKDELVRHKMYRDETRRKNPRPSKAHASMWEEGHEGSPPGSSGGEPRSTSPGVHGEELGGPTRSVAPFFFFAKCSTAEAMPKPAASLSLCRMMRARSVTSTPNRGARATPSSTY